MTNSSSLKSGGNTKPEGNSIDNQNSQEGMIRFFIKYPSDTNWSHIQEIPIPHFKKQKQIKKNKTKKS